MTEKQLEEEKRFLIAKHPNYRMFYLTADELKEVLKKWSRQDLINWLKWNDRNGVYDDEASMSEFGYIMSYEEGIEIITRQILED